MRKKNLPPLPENIEKKEEVIPPLPTPPSPIAVIPERKKLPPLPSFEIIQQGSDVALSEGIRSFVSEEPQKVKLLANLSPKEKNSLSLMETIYKRYRFQFLEDFALSVCTYSAATGDRRRSEQLTEVVKQPTFVSGEGNGVISAIKERLKR
jgi:hypothetical protein